MFDSQLRSSQVWMEIPSKSVVPANSLHHHPSVKKNYGQWCRNFNKNMHHQCPEGSVFHWYICCGNDYTDCCIGIQTWVYIIFGGLLLTVVLICLFSVVLQLFARLNGSSNKLLKGSSTLSNTKYHQYNEIGYSVPNDLK